MSREPSEAAHVLMAAEPGLAARTLAEHQLIAGGCSVCGPQPHLADGSHPCELRSTAIRSLYLQMQVVNRLAGGRPMRMGSTEAEDRPLDATFIRGTSRELYP